MHPTNGLTAFRKSAVTALSLVVLGGAVGLWVTDLRGRAEVRRTSTAWVSAQHRQNRQESRVQASQAQIGTTVSELHALEASIAQDQTSLAASNSKIASIETGLVLGGFDISALNTCLGGVTQALDQVAVGQTQGALSSLGSVSTSCNAAHPAPG